MGIREDFNVLKDWMSHKKMESNASSKIIQRQLKKEKKEEEYFNFKREAFDKIDEMLIKEDNSMVVLRPWRGKEQLFYYLSEDEDFKRYYKGRITAGGELEVSVKTLGD